jgi:hypothetical protein
MVAKVVGPCVEALFRKTGLLVGSPRLTTYARLNRSDQTVKFGITGIDYLKPLAF